MKPMNFHLGSQGPVVFEADYFVSVVEEFCTLLMAALICWWLVLVITHYIRVLGLRNSMKSFYKGLTAIQGKGSFIDYVKGSVTRMKKGASSFLIDLLADLLHIFQTFQAKRNRFQYISEINRLRADARDMFSHNNTRTLAIQLTGTFFVFAVFLLKAIFEPGALNFEPGAFYFEPEPFNRTPFIIVTLFSFSSLWLYKVREKKGDRTANEIDKLETLYEKYFAQGH